MDYIALDNLGNGKKAGDVLNVPADIDQKSADLLLKKGRIVEQENEPTEERKSPDKIWAD